MQFPGGKNQHFRHLPFFAFHRGKKQPKLLGTFATCMSTKMVCEAQKWRLWTRRPAEFDEEHLKAFLKENGRQTSRELAERMNCTHTMLLNRLNLMRFVEKLGAWMPHELTKKKRSRLTSLAIVQHALINSASCIVLYCIHIYIYI